MAKETSHKAKTKRKATGFTMIRNSFIEDASLSWRAKGLFSYFMSKPEDWTFRVRGDVVKKGREGRDAVYNAINELVDAGYISRVRGLDGSVTYHFFECKEDNDQIDYLRKTLKPHPENQEPEKPDPEKPDPENQDVLVIPKDSNTESSNTDVSKVGKTPPAKPEESAPSLVEQNSKKFIVNRLLDLGVGDELVAEYWHYRETIKRNRLTNRAVSMVINECERHNFNLIEAIKLQIAHGWIGFKVQWVHNQNQSFGNNKRPQMSKREAVEAHNAKIAEELKAQFGGIDYEH